MNINYTTIAPYYQGCYTMAKRKQRSPMPAQIDYEEWEEQVRDREARIRYDKDFLAVCEWFICADAASETIGQQLERCISEDDKDMLISLFSWLTWVGWVIQDPETFYKPDTDDFEREAYYDDTLPESVIRVLIRLAYVLMTSRMDMGNTDPYRY